MTKVLSLLAFLLLAGFLGVLAWKVPRLDLFIILGLTIALVAYDLGGSALKKRRG